MLYNRHKTKEFFMFLIFNKEFRETEKTMSILQGKAKKSEKMVLKHKKDKKGLEWEVYELDTLDIWFTLTGCLELVVKDKSGNNIIDLDCHYDSYNELQNAKANQFSNLLQNIRKMYDKRVEAQKMKDAAVKAKKAAETKTKAENAEKARLQALADANSKLRGL